MQSTVHSKGFLYHAPTQQVLLAIDSDQSDSHMCLFSATGKTDEDSATALQKAIEKSLGIKVPLDKIRPIYEYENSEDANNIHVHYCDVDHMIEVESLPSGCKAKWIPIAKLGKYKLSSQTRHDITIGERVIRAIREGNKTR